MNESKYTSGLEIPKTLHLLSMYSDSKVAKKVFKC